MNLLPKDLALIEYYLAMLKIDIDWSVKTRLVKCVPFQSTSIIRKECT